MKSAIHYALLAACLLAAVPARAKTFELPDDNPAVVADLPNGWKPHATDAGVEATSPDGETYVAIETATAKGMKQLIDDDMKFLSDNGVTVDGSTAQTQDQQFNGMPATLMSWKGKDKDGPTSITLAIFGVSDNLVCLMTAWSSPAGDKAHGPALTGILESIHRR